MMEIYRHYLAALAYRFQSAVRDAPEDFGDFQAGNGVRTPKEIVRHMIQLIRFVRHSLKPPIEVESTEPKTFDEAIEGFHGALLLLDKLFADSEKQFDGDNLLKLLQGPLADAITHIGQLATLRRIAGAPIPGENFVAVRVEIGNVGADQKLARNDKNQGSSKR